MLSKPVTEEIEAELKKYPDKKAACVEAMKIVQRQHGWLSDEGLHELAEYLEMTPDELESVATFYPLIFRKPVGKNVILVCDSVTCWVVGQENLQNAICEHLGIQLGETSEDGQFTLLPVGCLGACDHAPVMMINEELYSDVDVKNIEAILCQIRKHP